MSTEYVFDYEWEQGQRRIQLLEQYTDPTTFRYLDQLGVGPGWSCLEVGGGGGSVTRWLSERVGPEGRVLAIDLDTRFLKLIEAPNVEVRDLDVTAGQLPEGHFDLVHTRNVLIHIPDRHRVVSDLIGTLRPGGWVLFEECDAGPVEVFSEGFYREGWRAAAAAQAPAGVSYDWARRLPQVLAGAGLVEVGGEFVCPLYPGGSPAAELIRLSWQQVLDRLSVPEEERRLLERTLPRLDDPDQWLGGLGMVGAWGQRPR